MVFQSEHRISHPEYSMNCVIYTFWSEINILSTN